MSEISKLRLKEGEICRVSLITHPNGKSLYPYPPLREYVVHAQAHVTVLGILVVRWPTDVRGDLLPEWETSWDIQVFILNVCIFNTLTRIHREWGLNTADLKLRGAKPPYLPKGISPCREHLLNNILENPDKEILAKALREAIAKAEASAPPERVTIRGGTL